MKVSTIEVQKRGKLYLYIIQAKKYVLRGHLLRGSTNILIWLLIVSVAFHDSAREINRDKNIVCYQALTWPYI